ncbi:MAG TPA: beta-ketoacyl synthase N-terminal-like domain-containing protein [Symbiobacteriaceae bacterium]|jgi:polyketide synthase PksJ/polyketide synthase PksN
MNELEVYQRLARGEISRAEAQASLVGLLKGSAHPPALTDRPLLRPQAASGPQAGAEEAVGDRLVAVICDCLHLAEGDLEAGASFKDLGVDSINGVEIIRAINTAFGLSLDAVVLYEYATVEQLAAFVASKTGRTIMQSASLEKAHPDSVEKAPPAPPVRRTSESGVRTEVVRILGDMLHVPADEFDEDASFKDLGIDSINGVEIVRALNTAFGLNMDAVILYECPNAGLLAQRIGGLRQQFGRAPAATSEVPESNAPELPALSRSKLALKTKSLPPAVAEPSRAVAAPIPDPRPVAAPIPDPRPVAPPRLQIADEAIAIIGMSGRFPGANNMAEFWRNLESGTGSVTEIPADRWDVDAYYDPDPRTPNKTSCRFGGFVSDVDKFEPLFFNITPMEAEIMDPQQRLFLEESWKALEDAGYSDKAVSNSRYGVFVGATHGDYRKVLAQAGLENSAYAFTGLNPFILSGRVSYVLNLTGPNMTLDTACSSSLVAIHQACQSIRGGECDMALAGGVRLILAPDLHIQSSKIDLLSASGQCKAFDQEADGLVLGEGVGVVVLKPLRKALEDRDHIYGVIRGSAVNQDGRSNGITAPSVQAQVSLELDVYKRFGINPERISYVEANGTGTRLGDSVEMKALRESFGAYTDRRQFCAIGSVKTNIGHTTMASGVAGVMKVLLALKHRKLPPTLHFSVPNQLVPFKDSQFYVNTTLQPWAERNGAPRMAAVSSFGLSGTNCHVVIEEAPALPARPGRAPRTYSLIPVSAKTPAALDQKLRDLAAWLDAGGESEHIGDMAHTMATGRSHFPVRCALVVRDGAHLRRTIQDVLEKRESGHYMLGGAKGERSKSDPAFRELARRMMAELMEGQHDEAEYMEKHVVLADLYVKGYELDWERLYSRAAHDRISMPTYPFARDRYWVSASQQGAELGDSPAARLHPLVHANTSNLREQRFTSHFTGDEFYLSDHKVDGNKVLPGVAFLEMARAAGTLAAEQKAVGLRNFLWAAPVLAGQEVNVAVVPTKGSLQVEVYSGQQDQRLVHAHGTLVLAGNESLSSQPRVNLAVIREQCPGEVSGKQYYARFTGDGLYFGEGFRSIQRLRQGRQQALAELSLPPALKGSFSQFVLHPSMLDGAVETVVALVSTQDPEAIYMPFALGDLKLLGPVPERCYAYAAARDTNSGPADLQKFDLQLIGEDGQVLVAMLEFSVRRVGSKARGAESSRDQTVLGLLRRLSAGELKTTDVEQYLGVKSNG